jgi:FkbM family methyltransferase
MTIRDRVKLLLRMCGHAIVSTVHDRLNGIEATLHQLTEQNTHLAGNQTALLHFALQTTERLAQLEMTIRDAQARISTLATEHAARNVELQALAERTATKDDLDTIISGLTAVNQLVDQSTEIASTESALLQSGLHLVQSFSELRRSMEDFERRLSAKMRDYFASREDNHLLMTALEDARAESAAILQEAVSVLRQNRASLEPVVRATSEFLENQTVRQVCIETSNYVSTNPELGLLEFLYSYLPSRKVLDIGAHAGDVSERLLDTGYEVYAFEPSPENYSRLSKRLSGRKDFHSYNLALGNVTGDFPLHKVRDRSPEGLYEDETAFYSLQPHGMPVDLCFEGSVSVKVRRLAELHAEGAVPTDIGFVKIDTEGYDAEVVLGMGDHRYPAVMVEFWDEGIPFASEGLMYTVREMARKMRDRGYLWYLVIYRVWGKNETAFFSNHDQPVPGSWGNLVFFRQREIFDHAQAWCSAVLPRTYFKHIPSPAGEEAPQAAHAVRA